MKKIISTLIFSAIGIVTMGQNSSAPKDSTTFRGYLYNREYGIYIDFDFYHNNIQVPNQEIYGELPGYLGDYQDARKWLFVSAQIKGNKKADLNIINDYGSEDLKATLTVKNDSTYILRQNEGSTLKIARNRKWVKLPTQLEFIKRK
jgi:hypothetical protein